MSRQPVCLAQPQTFSALWDLHTTFGKLNFKPCREFGFEPFVSPDSGRSSCASAFRDIVPLSEVGHVMYFQDPFLADGRLGPSPPFFCTRPLAGF